MAARRIYEARGIRDGRPVRGKIVQATMAHHALVSDWASAFVAEIGEPALAASLVSRHIAGGEFWLWDDEGFRSLASLRPPARGAVRVSLVYTPPQHRRNGYAEALVRGLTQDLLGSQRRPLLYTDLANPTSNGVYRRIGYEAVAEVVLYRFAAPG
ncbi:MAG: GNAT family N-acetyltransferase [Steroidobacteraceae bacterium]